MAARGVNRSRRRPSPLIKRALYNGELGSKTRETIVFREPEDSVTL
jgi:hypothetical protein